MLGLAGALFAYLRRSSGPAVGEVTAGAAE
jgi:hypothetical protein